MQRSVVMGCYGIGITRVAAAAVEQHHDADGIIWPTAIAPYEVEIIPLNMDSAAVVETAERLYAACCAAGLQALLDDRRDRAGAKFADADLVGIPWRIVVGDRGLKEGVVEVLARRAKAETVRIAADEAVAHVRARVEAERDLATAPAHG